MHFWLRFSWQKLLQVILHISVKIFGRLKTKFSLTKRPNFFKYILLDLGRSKKVQLLFLEFFWKRSGFCFIAARYADVNSSFSIALTKLFAVSMALMLGVVACVLAVVCKGMQHLPTSLGPAVHRWKNATHKSL